MTAHMDAVTGLAIDPHGLYVLSGSESFLLSQSLPPSFVAPLFLSLSILYLSFLSLLLTFFPVFLSSLLSYSSGHDGSLRFWSMETKTCVQEITAHRKRFDESIYNVTCHLTKPFFASAGADGIAKVLL